MSLGGLALGIGMLVDSSIVVLESIHRCREEGDGRVESAIRGVGEVRSAVLASTLTSIAVFFPMVFLVGVAGQAFGDLGLAVVVSLLASAAVALYFIPMLASRRGMDVSAAATRELGLRRFASWRGFRADLGSSRRRTKLLVLPVLYWSLRLVVGLVFEVLGKLLLILLLGATWIVSRVIAPVSRRVGGFLAAGPLSLTSATLGGLHRSYPVALRWALAHPVPVLGAALLIFVGAWQLARSLDSELLPEVRQGEFTVEVALPVGTPLEETVAVLEPVERAILAEKEHIRSVILTVGYDPAQSERSDEGEHTARFKVLLERSRRGPAREDEVVEKLRRRFAAIPDLKSRISRPVLFSAKTPIEVEIQGDDLRQLRHYSERARAVLAGLPGLADVHATLREGAPEIRVVYRRERLARFGLNIYEVARLVRDKIQGYEATRFNLVDRRIPIVVRLGEQDRETVGDVEEMIVNPGGERPIRLTSVADVLVGEGPSEVRRVDGQRVAVVRANIASGSLSAAVEDIESALRNRVQLPVGMNFAISGQSEEWERSRGSLLLVLALSIFLVYVIMAIQFESLTHPLVIMFTIPLAFVGTVLVLWVFGIPLSVVVFLGMIMLAGIVVNNAIVLVDYVNQLRARGLAREEAIVTAGSVRLRPILMTTATTVLGLTPMALGLGDGAEIRTPMAIAVISGLLSSTFLTLLLIPTLYAVVDRLGARLLARRRGAEP
jgi:HAE1 family hydrophobic/amphiphilic exporter-1